MLTLNNYTDLAQLVISYVELLGNTIMSAFNFGKRKGHLLYRDGEELTQLEHTRDSIFKSRILKAIPNLGTFCTRFPVILT